MIKIYRLLIIILPFLILSACFNVKKVEGNNIYPEKLELLKIGMSKANVINLLGASTISANFGDNILIYAYEIYDRDVSFFNKDILDSKIIILTFNSDNMVSKIDIKALKDRRNIKLNQPMTKDISKKDSINSKANYKLNTFPIK